MQEPKIDLSKVKDVHEEETNIQIYAGLTNLSTLIGIRGYNLPVKLTVIVPTIKRGVHMSRLVKAINEARKENDLIEKVLKMISESVNKTLGKCKVIAKFDYPVNYSDQFMRIKIQLNEDNSYLYEFEKIGITACPCSKEVTGIGHMQRAKLKVKIKSKEILDFDDIAKKMDSCFSAVPSEYLKRIDEAKLILDSQENTRFVEDVVRSCIEQFPNALKIEARAFESIHAHDAYAVWYNKVQF
jgi:GTP cyclohydrolase FolE2